MVCRADAAMKPLPSAPLTREDKLIWLGINVPLNKKHFGYHYSKAYFASDRRDAELMHSIQRCRKSLGIADLRPMGWFAADAEFAPVPLPDLRSGVRQVDCA